MSGFFSFFENQELYPHKLNDKNSCLSFILA